MKQINFNVNKIKPCWFIENIENMNVGISARLLGESWETLVLRLTVSIVSMI